MTMQTDTLEGKVALVTGTSRGLGRGIALGLARHGADLVLTSRKLEPNRELAEEIRALGRRALPLATDIMVVEEIQATVSRAIEEFAAIDILVNNAGTNPIRCNAVDVEEWSWDKIIGTNLKGLFFFSQAVARHMMERGGGKIINISSAAAASGSPLASVYGASKAGVNQLTRTMALELAPYGINVNALGPSFFEVGLSEYVTKSEELTQAIIARTPLGRMGRVGELAEAVVYLASDAADYITGQVIYIDGGWSA
ncbi:MAG: glucose 1-dehydrogenase [Actinobacteria bacterium]|jgi:NAD(P)-dependent dehydrogenase (short-subunit alcohol dehydrogenase family)|nr:MAG: glucose 1-dehydrogenase [Actinomycetota bacterium]